MHTLNTEPDNKHQDTHNLWNLILSRNIIYHVGKKTFACFKKLFFRFILFASDILKALFIFNE